MTGEDRTTPRPWAWEAIGPGEGDIALGGAASPAGEFHVLTPYVCEACAKRGDPCLAPSEADAALIVEAVNHYDRLRAIEKVALRLLDSPWISPDERSELAAAIYVESIASVESQP